jgi:hypothetical protein
MLNKNLINNDKTKKIEADSYEEDIYVDFIEDINEEDLDDMLVEDLDDFEDKIEDIEKNYIDVDLDDETNKFDLLYHFNTNKHKQEGKHRLKEDTIFKGKTDKRYEDGDEYLYEENNDCADIVNFFDYESVESTNSLEQNNLTKDVYETLKIKTGIDFTQNRRKPNKETFNSYYNLLLKDLGFKYTKSEIFVELSFYFTDNIFNMYKLLDKKSATIIIKELINKGYLRNLENINFL